MYLRINLSLFSHSHLRIVVLGPSRPIVRETVEEQVALRKRQVIRSSSKEARMKGTEPFH